jgi:hypothetical protein
VDNQSTALHVRSVPSLHNLQNPAVQAHQTSGVSLCQNQLNPASKLLLLLFCFSENLNKM